MTANPAASTSSVRSSRAVGARPRKIAGANTATAAESVRRAACSCSTAQAPIGLRRRWGAAAIVISAMAGLPSLGTGAEHEALGLTPG